MLHSRLAVDPRVRTASAVETFHTLEEPYRDLQHGLATVKLGALFAVRMEWTGGE